LKTVYQLLEKSRNCAKYDQDRPGQYAIHELESADHMTIINPPGCARIRCPCPDHFSPSLSAIRKLTLGRNHGGSYVTALPGAPS
jgi:hypothetical protein